MAPVTFEHWYRYACSRINARHFLAKLTGPWQFAQPRANASATQRLRSRRSTAVKEILDHFKVLVELRKHGRVPRIVERVDLGRGISLT